MIDTIHSELRVFRDDIYPFLGGGNKGRKIKYIEKAVDGNGCNAVVTTGGIQSNHCRALALLAAQRGWKCTLVLHGNSGDFEIQNGNALLMRLSGAKIVFAEAAHIGAEMDRAITDFTAAGFKPYYIWGGGHMLEGGLAYIESIAALADHCRETKWRPDYIFLASGTGSTQAGILAGLDQYGLEAAVIGISVARKKEQAEQVVSDFYDKLCTHYDIAKTNRKVIVMDDYLCGGYEKYNEALLQLSIDSIKNYGFILDTTYSGKAFYGMQSYIKSHQITGNILFWHTGGILNFIAQQ